MQIKQNEIDFGGAMKFHYFPATTIEGEFCTAIQDVIHNIVDEKIYCIGKLKTPNNNYASFNIIKRGQYNTEDAFLLYSDDTLIGAARIGDLRALGWDAWFIAMKN